LNAGVWVRRLRFVIFLLLIRGHLRRSQAENPLIPLSEFARPALYLLNRTSNLPVVLGLFGFFGGVLAFGFIGVFLGPALLTVGYALFLEWNAAEVEERKHPTPAPSDEA
jgi:hypothetical protein